MRPVLPLLDPTIDEQARQLDPLCFDCRLPAMLKANSDNDVAALTRMLHEVVPKVDQIESTSQPQLLAMMRDLGVLMGSVRRLGVEPATEVQGLGEVLQAISARSGMHVPRDTIFHYTMWNPQGPRERTYTGSFMERMLLSAVRVSLPMLSAAVDVCASLDDAEPDDLAFALGLHELATLVGAMRDAMDMVMANVDPEFFARTLRPYFQEIDIGGQSYLGPAAAHVPLGLIDLRVWASDLSDDEYIGFVNHAAPYSTAVWRPLYQKWQHVPSFVSSLMRALEQHPPGEAPAETRAGVEAVARTMRSLVAFRGKHLAIARMAYAPDVGGYDLGSGGGSVGLLSAVADLTRKTSNSTRRTATDTRAGSAGRSVQQ